MSEPPPDWVLRRVVVDDDVIMGGDPMAIIDPVWWSGDFYQDYKALERSLAPFSWPQRLVWSVLRFDSEVNNGGLEQFFSNSTGMIWPEALEGFEALGRDDAAQILRAAVALFAHPPSRDREARCYALDEMAERVFDELDDRYYAINDFLDSLLSYIRNQPDAFYFDAEIYTPRHLPGSGEDD